MPVKAPDGVVLAGTAYGSGAAGVALFHEANATSAVWAAYAPALAARGVLVLAIDARGHGQSPDPAGRPDPAHYPLDGQAAVTWLRAHGARSITLVGASVGATLALFTAERPDLHIAAVVSLSGSAYDPWGIDVSAAGARAPKRVLLIAGADNGVDVSSTDFLKQVIPHARLVTVASGHHGTALLPDPAPNGGTVADLVTAFVLA